MKTILTILLTLVTYQIFAQDIIPLYPDSIPNSLPHRMKEIRIEREGNFFGYRNVSEPTLEVYLPDKRIATGTAVIIFPGGGYSMLSYHLEGIEIAKAYINEGITAFVVKYRLPSDSIMKDKSIGPLQDAQQAIKTVRLHAKEWNLNPHKIGVMGFSAGGHVASTAGTHFDKSYISNNEKVNLRPDFMILIYPVISMKDEITHQGSRTNLLGKNPERERIKFFSNEDHINTDTPPTWITHTGDDIVVPVENSIRFYKELIRNKVPPEMHLYPYGNHGFVLKLSTDEWMISLFKWIKQTNTP